MKLRPQWEDIQAKQMPLNTPEPTNGLPDDNNNIPVSQILQGVHGKQLKPPDRLIEHM